VFFRASAKNTEIALPATAPGTPTYKKVGALGIQYTAPNTPGVYTFEITATADRSKKAVAEITVLWELPRGSVSGMPLIYTTDTPKQFTASFEPVPGADPVITTPRFRVVESKHLNGLYARYTEDDELPPGVRVGDKWDDWLGTIDPVTGIFTPNTDANGSALIVGR